MIYACGPEGMLAATARTAMAHGRPCQVSVERIMGCGLGGCYSCVVPMRGDDGAFHTCVRASPDPVTAAGSDQVGLRSCVESALTWISRCRSARCTLKNPLIAASGCFGYGVEYADVVDLSSLGGDRVEGPVPEGARRSPGAAHRRDAGRHAERDRPAGHRRAALRRREAAGAARAPRHGHRQRLRHDDSTSTSRCRACCRTPRASPRSS